MILKDILWKNKQYIKSENISNDMHTNIFLVQDIII